jgi:uncharacterized protein YbjT (DUF2867 family)
MKVLITGSTGYIGRRLKHNLIQDENVSLRLFVRNKNSVCKSVPLDVEIVQGDTFDKEALKEALTGIDTAYYLIHSLNRDNYKDLDKISAQNFIDVAQECGVKRVIYLGGLGVKSEHTSEHLLSRIETGEVLSSSSSVQTIWIRAGVIIGSGSASFEIIRNLVEKLPVMTTPKWVSTLAQSIAVDDVLRYLQSSLYLEHDKNIVVDIGSDKLSYKEMMIECAKVLNLKRMLIPVPMLSINISSYWLNLFTPVPFSVAKALIEGLESEVVVQNDNAKIYYPNITPIPYPKAVELAIKEIEDNQIVSRWNDNGGKVWDEVHEKEFSDAIFVDRKVEDISDVDISKVYTSVTMLGGESGWFDYDFLWQIRGAIDKLIGGVGLHRGRRDSCDLRTGDCLDFWKVVDLKENERLLLYAQMKLPGKAWLEFKIKDNKLIQSAYFYPKGIWGRLYWYSLIPMHYFVFNNMIKSLIKRAKELDS